MKRLLRRLWDLLAGPDLPPVPATSPHVSREGQHLRGEATVYAGPGRVTILFPLRVDGVALDPALARGLAHALWEGARAAELAQKEEAIP